MPSFSSDESRRRLIYFAALLALACVALFFVTRRQEDRTRVLLTNDLEVKAKQAIVLFEEAHLVCLDAAGSILRHRRKLSKKKTEDGRRISADTWEGAMPAGAGEELGFAFELIRQGNALAGRARRTSLRLAPHLVEAPVDDELTSLARTTRELCVAAQRESSSLDGYESSITSTLRRYKAQLARLGVAYAVSEAERVATLDLLEPRLVESRRAAAEATAALHDDDVESWVPAEEVARKSPSQLRAERRDLQAEEEWRQRQTEQRESLHREAIGRLRSDTQPTQRALPSVGLQEVPRESLTGRVSEARSWAETYERTTGPVTVALRRFDMVRRIEVGERTHRACRALFSKVSDLLQSQELFASPSEGLNALLRDGYTKARKSAEACMAGDMEAANRHFDEAETLLARAESSSGLISN